MSRAHGFTLPKRDNSPRREHDAHRAIRLATVRQQVQLFFRDYMRGMAIGHRLRGCDPYNDARGAFV